MLKSCLRHNLSFYENSWDTLYCFVEKKLEQLSSFKVLKLDSNPKSNSSLGTGFVKCRYFSTTYFSFSAGIVPV